MPKSPQNREIFLLEKEADIIHQLLSKNHAFRWAKEPNFDEELVAESGIEGICLWQKKNLPPDLKHYTDRWMVLAQRIVHIKKPTRFRLIQKLCLAPKLENKS